MVYMRELIARSRLLLALTLLTGLVIAGSVTTKTSRLRLNPLQLSLPLRGRKPVARKLGRPLRGRAAF